MIQRSMLCAAMMAVLAAPAMAQQATPAQATPIQATPIQATPVAPAWSFAPDMAYGYGADGQTTAYKLGTNNAKLLFKGAKKVPRNTIFFVGENGQLYMRTGPYLDNGKFSFGPG